MQNYYSLIYREEEREMLPTLKASDNSSICYNDDFQTHTL
jgi:aryl-alcohol dehydrogenase-like predicted oxidoreductase